jgi:class 3 adenylate cyclase/tetratricopeptide (TPR) repeat protein
VGAGCDNVAVPTSTDGWYPRSFVLTDIVDSVSLWERDAELMSRAVARHDAMISREVDAAGGTLVRSKGEGDSTFSVFAHPAEAVVAAVAIQGAVGAERWPTTVPLRVRAGVHTGDAEPREGDWYGPAVNRAARLRARAGGGQTLLSGVTAGLVAEQLPEDVRLLYRGRRVLRGIERPEEVWELVAADDPRLAVPRLAKLRGLPLARTGFVGRAVELGLLDELVGEARAGEPVTVLICGEAGAGKTRLVAEMAAVARDGGTRTVAGNCTVVGRTALAFAPFAEVLRTVVQELAIDEGPSAGRVAPRLARLVAGPGGGTASGDPRGPGPVGASAQLGLFEEVLDTLESAAVPSGLLVVIEDLHWADPSSRGLFEFLSRNLRGAAVALVGTVRTDEPDNAGFLAWLAEIQRAPRAIRVDLEPFGRNELADLLAGVLGQPPSPELAGQVYERSGGNAFLAEELVAAGERGDLVPATVRSLVVARMAGLTAPARSLVRLAAVAGVRVGHGLLAAAGDLGDEVLLAASRELAENHLLVADRSGEGYAFRHALTREAVYDDLLPGERHQLHRAVAQALTDEPVLGQPAGWTVTEAVAEHWFAAGELEHALAAWVAAGNAAVEVFALPGALGHYQRALALWDRVADPETVAGVERPVLLERAADAASGAGEHDHAIRCVDAAIGELEHTPGASVQVGLLCERKAWYLGWAGGWGESLESARRAVALVPAEPPTRARARVLAVLALALSIGERYDEASRVAVANLDAARSSGARKQEGEAHLTLGVSLLMTGTDPEAAIDEYEQALAIGRAIGDVEAVALWSANLADALIRLGRLDDAAATALEAAHTGVQAGALRNEVGLILFNGAEALFLGGRWDECEHVLERLPAQRAGGAVDLQGLGLAALLHASRGRNDAAAAAIATAADLGLDDPVAEGMLRAAQAQVALSTGDLDAARRAALDGLDTVAAPETQREVVAIVALASVGLRIEADRARAGRARHDATEEQAAVESARTIAERTLAERTRAAAAAQRPEVTRAHRVLCDAEVGRAKGRSDPDLWHRAADAGAAEGDPYRTAYARYREAEAVLASRGERARAVDALIGAYAIATELRAEPLRGEIEALARRARIELSDQPLPATGPPGLSPPTPRSG